MDFFFLPLAQALLTCPQEKYNVNTMEYNLHDDVQLKTSEGLRINSLLYWIQKDPALLYIHIYKPGLCKYPLRKISIEKSAFILFKQSLAKKNKSLYNELIKRQDKLRFRKNCI